MWGMTAVLLCIVGVSSLSQPQRQPIMSRRTALVASFGNSLAATATSALLVVSPVQAEGTDGSVFCGTYTDPINHPGGTRTIRLIGDKLGDYQLAEIVGGGGVGEPKSFILPAVVVGDRAIIIDFSPKGGPRDFTGVIDKDGIRFPRDGNKWPRVT
jgi:hypothetical protein